MWKTNISSKCGNFDPSTYEWVDSYYVLSLTGQMGQNSPNVKIKRIKTPILFFQTIR